MEVKRFFRSLFCLAAVIMVISSCTPRGYQVFEGYAQGGQYRVKVNMRGVTVSDKEVARKIDSILVLVDTTLSGYNKGSQLSRYNAGEDVAFNSLFDDMVEFSREKYEQTGGALDVASAALFDLWGFGFTSDSLPSAERVQQVLDSCGMDRLDLRPKMNFNAVAQGYTSDLIASYLYSVGAKDMLVDIGEIYCDGVNPQGQPWSIGVERPVDGNNVLGAELTIIWQSDGKGQGVVTSGNYRKFYVRDGRKYAHTIDPRTGYPVQHNLLSATIIAPTAADADAYATYCMVIGLDAAREFIASHPELEGYLIYDEDGSMKEWMSEGFTSR